MNEQETKGYDGYDEDLDGPRNDRRNDPRLVNNDFVKHQGLSAKATDWERGNRTKIRVMSHAFEKAVALAGYGDEFEKITSLWDELVQLKLQGAKDAAKQTIKNILQKLLLSTLAPWLFGISLAIYTVQFVMAIISLVGIGAWAIIEDASSGVTGTVTNMVLGIFGSSMQALFPAEYLALGFWALASIIGMCGFIAFIIFFNFIGVNMTRSVISSLVLYTTLAITLMPVGNLLPGLFLWVAYVIRSETSVFTMLLEHHSTTHRFNAPLRTTERMMSENISQQQKLSR